MMLEKLVDDYLLRKAEGDPCVCEDELLRYAGLCTIDDVIAQLAVNSRGRRHDHQRRIAPYVLEDAQNRLRSAGAAILAATSFKKVYEIVNDTIRPVKGIGDLVIYDFSTRLSTFLKLSPQQVYLHAGAAEGARALGISKRGSHPLDPGRFPPPLNALPASEIENFLCIYKRALRA